MDEKQTRALQAILRATATQAGANVALTALTAWEEFGPSVARLFLEQTAKERDPEAVQKLSSELGLEPPERLL